MLHGYDISHHQNLRQFRDIMQDTDTDFIILKATEGRSYVDSTFNTRAKRILDENKLLGAYHFARPENNTPDVEAFNFCKTVLPYRGKCALFLDWEDKALSWSDVQHQNAWIASFMKQVAMCLNQRMLLYTSEYYVGRYAETVLELGNGLWIARWGKDEPTTVWEIWQYQGAPLDRDVANMNYQDWYKWSSLRDKEQYDVINGCDCHCGCSLCDNGQVK